MANILTIFFPFQQGATTFPRTAADDEEAIKCSILQILTVSTGERVMRGDFGVRLQDHVFEGDSDGLRDNISRTIRDAIGRWEPRVKVDDVIIETDEVTEPGVIMVTVEYTIISTGTPGSVTIAAA